MIAALALAAMQVTAAEALPRGAVLDENVLAAPAGTDLSAYLGQQLKRPVFAGKAISPSDLAAPDLVARQSAVEVIYRKNGLALSLPGRALGAGARGEVVSVLIEGRRAPLRARVTGEAEVEVTR